MDFEACGYLCVCLLRFHAGVEYNVIWSSCCLVNSCWDGVAVKRNFFPIFGWNESGERRSGGDKREKGGVVNSLIS